MEDEEIVLRGRYDHARDSDRTMMRFDDAGTRLRADDDLIDNRELALYTSVANGSSSELHFWTHLMESSQLGDSGSLPNHAGHLIDSLQLSDDSNGSGFQAVLIYDTILTESERQDVEQYLAQKYAIPEPGSLALLGCGGLAMLLRRRR